ncbi:MAG: hypothetical protein ACRC7O_09375, partial [Fimbriiglobus sp.]
MIDLLTVFGIAAVTGCAATYAARAAAGKIGLLDKPDGRRKIHARPIAVAGGIGVLTGTLAALGLASAFVPTVADGLTTDPVNAASLLAAALVIAVVGLVDDAVNLRARYKLLGQFLAAGLLIGP